MSCSLLNLDMSRLVISRNTNMTLLKFKGVTLSLLPIDLDRDSNALTFIALHVCN